MEVEFCLGIWSDLCRLILVLNGSVWGVSVSFSEW